MAGSTPDATAKAGFTASEWAGDAGRRWLASVDTLERALMPIGEAFIAHAGFVAGEQVVDIGCGGGWTTQQIASIVGEEGHVAGLDISADLIALARERADATGVPNIRFEVGDAAAVKPAGAPFDRLFSRFGTMFFPDPYAAFANLRHMLADNGRLDIAVWGAASENRWYTAIMEVVARHIELPAPVPRAPGQFALGDPDYVRDILAKAGFAAPRITAWEEDYHIGGPGRRPDESAAFVLEAMHVGTLVEECDTDTQDTVRRDLAALFADHETSGGVALPAKVLFVTADAAEEGRAGRGNTDRNKLGVRYEDPQPSISPGGTRHEP